ncbi:hypothetical protein SLNSH_18975 [Alsobacter soli]|uniref:PepSY domain-containing protein n=2 Tax=Alsobacter soli TaxID=2109933 RepID=A0A2T1HP83_9HYPH|nr:hypothetical protein SLNSH_18975 [Alsobacter soli]
MRRTSSLALAAILLASGSNVALAQGAWSSGRGDRYEYGAGYRGWSDQGSQRRYVEGRGFGHDDWAANGRPFQDRHWGSDRDRSRYGAYEGERNGGGAFRSSSEGYGPYENDRYGRFSRDGEPRQFGAWEGSGRATRARESDRQYGGEDSISTGAVPEASDFRREARELRRELRDYGLRDIRILNTSYLVEARLPSGRTVLLIADPPPMSAGASASQEGSSQNGDRASASSDGFRSSQTARNRKSDSSKWDRNAEDRNGSPGSGLDGVTAQEVRSSLQARGFSDIRNLRRDGSTFVGEAGWYGDQVSFRVDGRNGYLIEPNRMTSDQVQTMLDNEGWKNVQVLDANEKSYKLKGTKNGINYQLRVDAETGQVYRKAAMDGSPDQETGSIRSRNPAAGQSQSSGSQSQTSGAPSLGLGDGNGSQAPSTND